MIVTSVQIKTAKTQKHLYCPVFTKNRLAFASLFFYPLRKQWHIIKGDLSPLYLISPSGLYIITPLGVYQKCFRNDDIQRLAPLMISTALP